MEFDLAINCGDVSGVTDEKDTIQSHSVRHQSSLLRPGASVSNPEAQQFNTKPPYLYPIIMHIHMEFLVVKLYSTGLSRHNIKIESA